MANGEMAQLAKLLLVDRSRNYIDPVRDCLHQAGWMVDCAYSLEEAVEAMLSYPYAICTVGMRLRDGHDSDDRSGLQLIDDDSLRQKTSPNFVVLTQTPRFGEVIDLFRRRRIVGYVLKDQGVEALIRELARIEDEILPVDFRRSKLLLQSEAPPATLVEIIPAINAEVIKRLKEKPGDLWNLHSRAFEELVAELLASYGWQVDLTKQTRDGGYDIFAVRRDLSGLASTWIVECKRFRRDRKVGIGIVRDVYAAKLEVGAGMALLATTSFFTQGVVLYKASRYDLELRDLHGIIDWINQYHPREDGQLYRHNGEARIAVPGKRTGGAALSEEP